MEETSDSIDVEQSVQSPKSVSSLEKRLELSIEEVEEESVEDVPKLTKEEKLKMREETMSRHKHLVSAVWDHFAYDDERNRTYCIDCDYSVKGKFATPLIRHLGKHPERYHFFLEAELKRPSKTRKRSSNFLAQYLNDMEEEEEGKRKRRKNSRYTLGMYQDPNEVEDEEEPQRKRGRPKKHYSSASNITLVKTPVRQSKDGSYVTIEIVQDKPSSSGLKHNPVRVLVNDKEPVQVMVRESGSNLASSSSSPQKRNSNALIPLLNQGEDELVVQEKRRRKFRNMLTELLITSNLNANMIDNDVFRKLIQFLDPNIHLPSRETLVRQMVETNRDVKQEMKDLLAAASKITIGADICEKKTVTQGMLAITAYFYNHDEQKRYILSLALKELPDAVDSLLIRQHLDSCMREYQVSKKQLFRFMAGTGSKITNQDTDILADEGEQASVYLNVHFCEQNPEQCTPGCYANTFRVLSGQTRCKKLSCFVNILDSIWKPYEKKSPFDPSVAVASKLIHNLKKAGTNVSYILDDEGKAIKTPRRWIPLFCKIQHLVRSQQTIDNLCHEYGLEKIPDLHWQRLKKYVTLLAPFKLIRDQQDTQTEATISRVIPAISFLDQHLSSHVNLQLQHQFGNHHFIDHLDVDTHNTATEMLNLLRTKSAFFANPGVEGFDEIYLAATCLDPAVHNILTQEQVNMAYNYLRQLSVDYKLPVSEEADSEDESLGNSSQSREQEQPKEETPKPTQSKKTVRPGRRGCRKGKLTQNQVALDEDVNPFEDFLTQTVNQAVVPSTILDKELATYTQFVAKKLIGVKTGALEFWTTNSVALNELPLLRKIALDILSVPSTAYDIENVFVTAGHACEGRKQRINAENLESQVLLRNNSPFLKIFADE